MAMLVYGSVSPKKFTFGDASRRESSWRMEVSPRRLGGGGWEVVFLEAVQLLNII